ncbi:hypothetical protein [Cohnella cholangitidis]|uniref:DUF5666 domain-containing protein n=1 Tax=Cohnella cholangitidis TaxID=2598458 RepID=A0A7G5C683_9BACL|nr:hypothetical protein [Cohnella cholangitidis]QMV44717.1 hypothetical protein FPL14_28760 [Cohnella cholangitidis]
MYKQSLMAILILTVAISLAACGNNANEPAGSPPGTSSPTSSNVPTNEPTTSEPSSSSAQPDAKKVEIEGTVTALDGNGVLIIDKDGQAKDKNPRAVWVDFSGSPDVIKDVRIGYRVKAESTNAAIQETYPESTKGSKLEIVNSDTGNGDLQGTITKIITNEANSSPSVIEVDGTKLSLIPITVYWNDDQLTDAKTLKVGDKVQVWYPGYTLGDEKQITQIKNYKRIKYKRVDS